MPVSFPSGSPLRRSRFALTGLLSCLLFVTPPMVRAQETPAPAPDKPATADSKLLSYLGLAASQAKDYDNAIRLYTEALAEPLDAADILLNHSLVSLAKRQTDQAIQDLNTVIALMPDLADAYVNRGYAYMQARNYSGAIADFNKALALRPDKLFLLNNLANAYGYNRQYAQAVATYKRFVVAAAVSTDSDIKTIALAASRNIGMAYIASRDYSQAITAFSSYIDAAPGDPDGYLGRGDAEAADSQYSAAIDDYQMYLTLNPRDPGGYGANGIGLAYYLMGKYQKSKNAWTRWMPLDSSGFRAYIPCIALSAGGELPVAGEQGEGAVGIAADAGSFR